MITREQLVKKYVDMLRIGRSAVFIGAGLSKACGFVDWRELLKEPAKELGLDINKEHDLIGIAEMVVQKRGNRGGLTQEIFTHFSEDVTGTENHRIIVNLPIPKIWTTNYDEVIENSFRQEGVKCQVIRNDANLVYSNVNTMVTLYKMHGDVSQPEKTVLTRNDYELYDINYPMLANSFRVSLIESSFLFLGFSFTDPNLQQIFGKIRAYYGQNSREHFTIMREPQPLDDNYEYEIIKFNLFVEDLKRYNVQTLPIKDYNEITEVLKDIETSYYRKNIFVSGSYFKPDDDFNENKLQRLCYELGKRIISEGYNLTSGFGLGIGASIITGSINELYQSGKRSEFYHRLNLYPFPLNQPEIFKKYRQDMIRRCGFCIFISGNKDGYEIAPGVIEEYEIALDQDKIIIPIGSTGSAAKKIWDEENEKSNFSKYNEDINGAFNILNDKDKSINEIIDAVIYILKQLTP